MKAITLVRDCANEGREATFIAEGPDAKKAIEIVRATLEGKRPTMQEAIRGLGTRPRDPIIRMAMHELRRGAEERAAQSKPKETA